MLCVGHALRHIMYFLHAYSFCLSHFSFRCIFYKIHPNMYLVKVKLSLCWTENVWWWWTICTWSCIIWIINCVFFPVLVVMKCQCVSACVPFQLVILCSQPTGLQSGDKYSKAVLWTHWDFLISRILQSFHPHWDHQDKSQGTLKLLLLQGVFGPRREEVAGGWRKLHNEELHNLYT
jgi:hypothetical protein